MNKEVGMKSLIFLFLFSFVFVAYAEETKAPPMREISVIVTKEGYYPKSFSVFEGEKIKFYVTSTVEEPNCLIVEAHKVFMAANKGKVTEGEVVFDKPGEYAFYCPSSKNDGKIVVLKKVNLKREVASEKNSDSMIWTPKEY
jgi:plastocyanin